MSDLKKSSPSQSGEADMSPDRQVVDMTMNYWVSRAIYVAARLGIADLLADGDRSSEELAKSTQVHGPSLYRLLRALTNVGLFTEGTGKTFGLTPLGDTLRSNAPGATRSTVLAMGSDWQWLSWCELEHSIRTGKTGVEKAVGMGVFDYFAKNPEEAHHFNNAMIGIHGPETTAVAKAYDFSGIANLVDIGGGTGNLISAILRANPKLSGIIYDLPHVTADAKERIADMKLAERCEVIGGDFFKSVPNGEAYIMSHIIHDWDEDRCLTILRNCRKANPDAKVFIVEMIVPPPGVDHPAKFFDLVMLVIPGGQERTEEEYAALLGKAGYRLERVVPTDSPVSVVEGVPA